MKEELKEADVLGSIFACQKNGWTNLELFTEWFQHFADTVKSSVEEKVVLLLDGHVSHTQNILALQKYRECGVIILSLPPLTTHRLQPLDVSFLSHSVHIATKLWTSGLDAIQVFL